MSTGTSDPGNDQIVPYDPDMLYLSWISAGSIKPILPFNLAYVSRDLFWKITSGGCIFEGTTLYVKLIFGFR